MDGAHAARCTRSVEPLQGPASSLLSWWRTDAVRRHGKALPADDLEGALSNLIAQCIDDAERNDQPLHDELFKLFTRFPGAFSEQRSLQVIPGELPNVPRKPTLYLRSTPVPDERKRRRDLRDPATVDRSFSCMCLCAHHVRKQVDGAPSQQRASYCASAMCITRVYLSVPRSYMYLDCWSTWSADM